MKNKTIVVCLKYYNGELNPFDGSALECALQSGAKEIIALTMAPLSVLNAFRSLTRLGVKCILISDPCFAGSDTQATSYVLAKAINCLHTDLIFCGRQSIDGDTAQVPPMLAKRLGFEIKTNVIEFNNNDFVLRSGESFAAKDKMVITFEKIKQLRFPSIFSKLSEVLVYNNKQLQIEEEKCGLKGSSTRVIRVYESSVGRRTCQFVSVDTLGELIHTALEKEKVEAKQQIKEKLDVIYFVGQVESVAKNIADKVVRVSDKQTPEQTATYLINQKARVVLWEDSDKLKILASEVAVLTGAGLCADCTSFRVEKGKFIMTRPALGGTVTADVESTSLMAFATVKTARKGVADIVFSVGKGAINCIDKITNLAIKYNAEICCSRAVADSGKLPYEKQVGLTGRTVSPKVYVAFGISGAVQHTCAIAGANTVIAVNSNQNERIFDYADYGVITDIENVEL